MDDGELVKRLRKRQEFEFIDVYKRVEWEDEDALEAADRIEALTEQLEAARADAKQAEAYAEDLRNLLCLADEAIMDLNGCFPLGPSKREHALRKVCRAIRAVTGNDYDERKRRASATLAEIEGEKG